MFIVSFMFVGCAIHHGPTSGSGTAADTYVGGDNIHADEGANITMGDGNTVTDNKYKNRPKD